MPCLLLLESQELWILTMILSMFYFMFQFHIADTLGRVTKKRELECSLSLLKLVLISQNLTFWIWWLRIHKSKGWTAGETNRLTYSASCLLEYTHYFLHWATQCKHSHWHMEWVLLLELVFLGLECSGSLRTLEELSNTSVWVLVLLLSFIAIR